jgi:hypothetical protein
MSEPKPLCEILKDKESFDAYLKERIDAVIFNQISSVTDLPQFPISSGLVRALSAGRLPPLVHPKEER